MTRVIQLQFWAPFRGRVDVTMELRQGMNVERASRYALKQAVGKFNLRWPFPADDRKQMTCIGARDGYRTVRTKDVPLCFGDYPSIGPQDRAENDCHGCKVQGICR